MGKKTDLLGAFSEQLNKGTPNNPTEEIKEVARPQKSNIQTPQKETTKKEPVTQRAKTKPISFYDTDLKIMRDIQEIIEESTGERINDSSAMRLALRSLNLNREKLTKTYAESKKSDGRRK